MHPINKFLGHLGFHVSVTREKTPLTKEWLDEYKAFKKNYKRYAKELKSNPGGFKIVKALQYENGLHPANYKDFECGFSASQIKRINPENILDVGSYRHFILGLLSAYKLTTIDVRDRVPICDNETVITCDAKELDIPDNEFAVVLSLSAIEHFGLGRYGDTFDLEGDKKSFKEMIRVLKPGGRLIFTTMIAKKQAVMLYNAGRIYNYEMIKDLCTNMELEEETYFSKNLNRFCSFDEVTESTSGLWDSYCGCWRKK